jgi:hypothetical protein
MDLARARMQQTVISTMKNATAIYLTPLSARSSVESKVNIAFYYFLLFILFKNLYRVKSK